MYEGKMTYAGIATLAIAFLVGGYASGDEVSSVVNGVAKVISDITAIVGTVLAIYGRYRISRAEYKS
ncbi:MAG: hypothetical protein HGA33_06080 [Candidatus Moranbacteria bacterium]|nr:hypothetical protein [Candidatus Moranbacteria bacterium]